MYQMVQTRIIIHIEIPDSVNFEVHYTTLCGFLKIYVAADTWKVHSSCKENSIVTPENLYILLRLTMVINLYWPCIITLLWWHLGSPAEQLLHVFSTNIVTPWPACTTGRLQILYSWTINANVYVHKHTYNTISSILTRHLPPTRLSGKMHNLKKNKIYQILIPNIKLTRIFKRTSYLCFITQWNWTDGLMLLLAK
jgi:hypothetical protein